MKASSGVSPIVTFRARGERRNAFEVYHSFTYRERDGRSS
jgi:hypothetical protein